MAAKKKSGFPYEQAPYTYEGPALKKAWGRLHAGDLEPFPDAEAVARLTGSDKGAAALATRLQDAWRAFHRGDFEQAIEAGVAAGLPGTSPANKAAAVLATYLVDDDRRALRLLNDAAKRAERATREAPDYANAWYFQAFVLGRYAQRVSVVKALAEGVGGKVREALDRVVELEPKHADVQIALGLYHAEIIDKVGALAGRLTYGADAASSVKHFEKALKLNPGSAIAHMEYANGLLMLHGDKRRADAVRLYRKAAACEPADAMERLDVEQAKAELED